MTNDKKLPDVFESEPDCGLDASSDKGYWLEDADKETLAYLISWREKVELSPELLSKMAPIPLEEYLLLEKGERKLTNGDAFRIDNAIIRYTNSKKTPLQRSWDRGWLASCRRIIRRVWYVAGGWDHIPGIVLAIIYFGFLRQFIPQPDSLVAFSLRYALRWGLPLCFAVWLFLQIVRGLKKSE